MAFHWRDGIHFERQANGDVRIFNEIADAKGEIHPMTIRLIPASDWVSIVSNMALIGGHPASYQVAAALHLGVPA